MAPSRTLSLSSVSLSSKIKNKANRQARFLKEKKERESAKRDERFRRKRTEAKNPKLREERVRHNQPLTLDKKRVWDDDDGEADGKLGVSVDVLAAKKRRTDHDLSQLAKPLGELSDDSDSSSTGEDSDLGSLLESGSESDADSDADASTHDDMHLDAVNPPSPAPSTTSTNFTATPEALALQFPSLFEAEAPEVPKTLITTSINSTLYREAEILTMLFPHSTFIRRSSHRYGHKFSVREIAKFAANRNFTNLVVLKEDQKRPTGLSVTHLPSGPTLNFSISTWVEGKKLPGHGKATEHYPELIVNNFRTPLGVLTAQMFRKLFPARPDLSGRQVVTLHNQRDYLFLRRHRYVFREKKGREKSVVGPDGKEVQGVEGIRAGLQELGPRLTLKLRRVDKGVGRADQDVHWEWKGRMEKQRSRFQL